MPVHGIGKGLGFMAEELKSERKGVPGIAGQPDYADAGIGEACIESYTIVVGLAGLEPATDGL